MNASNAQPHKPSAAIAICLVILIILLAVDFKQTSDSNKQVQKLSNEIMQIKLKHRGLLYDTR